MTLPRGQLKTPKDAGNPNVFTASGHNDLNGSNRPSLLDDSASTEELPKMSQKSLFLALYAKYIRGEKRKDEESEMVLGPADGGATVNKELPFISRLLEKRLTDSGAEGKEDGQGWLEYLYGIVLARGKNHEEAKRWLLKSVHLYSYNWGVWEELGSLVGSLEEVSFRSCLIACQRLTFEALSNFASCPAEPHELHVPCCSAAGALSV